MSNLAPKLLWSVDAFSEDTVLHNKMVMLLKRWVKKSGGQVEPVYVMSPDQLSVPTDLFAALKSESEVEAKDRLKKMVARAKIPNCLAPTLLVTNDFSLRSAVKALIDYGRSSGAELIAMGTQSKRGVTRFLFGSFAESLVLYSDIPVLLVTPRTRSLELKHLLFATDLSEASRQAFEKVLEVAEKQRLKITLINKVEYLSNYTKDLILKSPSYEEYLKKDLLKRQRAIEEMAMEARKRGLTTHVIVDRKPGSISISDFVLRAGKKHKADLIAVASQSGVVASNILGSVARQIIRHAKCPVWIVHPGGKR